MSTILWLLIILAVLAVAAAVALSYQRGAFIFRARDDTEASPAAGGQARASSDRIRRDSRRRE